MVRLRAEDLAALEALLRPGESRGACYLRLAREASVTSRTWLVRHRRPPLFAAWVELGPLTAEEAADQGEHLARKGWEVETLCIGEGAERPPPKSSGISQTGG